MRRKTEKALRAAVACALALCMASPAVAYAAEQTTRTYTFTAAGEDAGGVPESLDIDGAAWKLVDKMVESKPVRVKSHVEQAETKQCWPADLDATVASFAGEKTATEDGVTETVRLEGVVPVAVVQDTEVAANEYVCYYGLPTNDMSQIPATWTGQADAAPVEATLSLAGCSWEVASTDALGMPKTYDARAVYRGLVTYKTLHHYDVTATYVGESEADSPEGLREYSVTAVFEKPEREIDYLAPLIAALAAGAVGTGIAVAWYRFKNVQYGRVEERRARPLGRGRAMRDSRGVLTFDFPPKFDLEHDEYVVVLRRDLASADGKLRIKWCRRVVYEGEARREVIVSALVKDGSDE